MNTLGRILRTTIYGTSHNKELGIIIDGCPVGIPISENDFTEDLHRRKNGIPGTSARIEEDSPIINSGVYNGFTNGTPLVISFFNKSTKSLDYEFSGFYRPGHSDFSSNTKYKGFNEINGGGQLSGRMTLPLVAAGVVAKKIISEISITANILSIGKSENINLEIENAEKDSDSLGGIIYCEASGIPAGLGEPFFDSVESLISHAIFSIPGAKAIEFGEGIKSAYMKGSEFNDIFISNDGKTKTNNAGGINGGITNGNNLFFRVFFRPPASIKKSQTTMNFNSGEMEEFKISGRHDTCYVLRTPVIVESLTALVLADLFLLEKINK